MEKETWQEEEQTPSQQTETEDSPKAERPLWQRICAWIGLILFVGVILMYYVNIMRGGR